MDDHVKRLGVAAGMGAALGVGLALGFGLRLLAASALTALGAGVAIGLAAGQRAREQEEEALRIPGGTYAALH